MSREVPPILRLAGKVAIITGAASGIGKAAASEFIRNGAKVIIADVQDELGWSAATELGPDATFVRCDVTDEAQVAAAIDLAVAQHGRLDVLFNNAGVIGGLGPSVTELDLADFDRTMAVNVRAVAAGIKHAARVMIPRRAGCILCTASVAGILGIIGRLSYSVSKAAVLGLVRSAVVELSRYGIRVNAISPASIATPLGLKSMKDRYPTAADEVLSQALRDAWELVGALEPADIAKAAVYLASDEARFVNGHNLVVDGGSTVTKRLNLPARL